MHDVDHAASGQLVDSKLACVNDRRAGQERGRSEAKQTDGNCAQARARACVLQKVRKSPRNRHMCAARMRTLRLQSFAPLSARVKLYKGYCGVEGYYQVDIMSLVVTSPAQDWHFLR